MKDPIKFDSKTYWDRRKKGFRGQVAVPGTKNYNREQRKIDKLARKLHLEKLREQDDKEEIKEIT